MSAESTRFSYVVLISVVKLRAIDEYGVQDPFTQLIVYGIVLRVSTSPASGFPPVGA